jgi:hypothetical protein
MHNQRHIVGLALDREFEWVDLSVLPGMHQFIGDNCTSVT